MQETKRLKVAALVDLPRSAQAGGHVKCWERLAAAASNSELPLDLCVYFSGRESSEKLGPGAIIRQLPPVFSTELLRFLPYVPDHTDLAPYHFRLAQELKKFDVIHTTDGFFAFARTAERISRKHGIPLVTSFHTDTPSYARIFTQHTIESLFGKGRTSRLLVEKWKLPERQGRKMTERLKRHVSLCHAVLVTRAEDRDLAGSILGKDRVHNLRLGADRNMFGPHRRDRKGVELDYAIPAGRIVVLFVGRVDIGKNIHTLVEAMENLLREGLPMHLITAGTGPAMGEVKSRLGENASVPGFVDPEELARLYASVDVLALTSEVEIRSMAGVEAMVSGCPVLVSKKSGVAALFEHSPAMITVESEIEAWQRALRTIADDPELRERMRETAIDYSRKHIASWRDIMAEDLFAVWQRAANDGSR